MRTVPTIFMRRLGLAVALLLLPACAHRAGRGAVSGVAEELSASQTKNAQDPNQQISRIAAERAGAGAVASLNEPEQRE